MTLKISAKETGRRERLCIPPLLHPLHSTLWDPNILKQTPRNSFYEGMEVEYSVGLCWLVVEVASAVLDADPEHRTKMAASDEGWCIRSQADN